MKMKKLLLFLIIVIMSVSISACTHSDEEKDNTETEVENVEVRNKEEVPMTAEQLAYNSLYLGESADTVNDLFSDLENLVIEDNRGADTGISIFPFSYFYTAEFNLTVVVSEDQFLTAICKGKLQSQVQFDTEGCDINPNHIEFYVQ